MERRKKQEIPMKFYEKRKQVFNTESSISHEIFIGVEDHQKITEKTERGVRVLVARYPDTYKIYFYKFIPVGSNNYPRGGIKVFNATMDQFQCFYFESVAVHPRGGKYNFEFKMNEL